MDQVHVDELMEQVQRDPILAQQLAYGRRWDNRTNLDLYKLLQDGRKLKNLQSSIVAPPPPGRGVPPIQHTQLPNHLPKYIQSEGKNILLVKENGQAGYHPPVAPKPFSAVNSHGHHFHESTFVSHGKSDSVDSSDGLRKSNEGSSHSQHANYHSATMMPTQSLPPHGMNNGREYASSNIPRDVSSSSSSSSKPRTLKDSVHQQHYEPGQDQQAPQPPPRNFKIVQIGSDSSSIMIVPSPPPPPFVKRPSSRTAYGHNNMMPGSRYGSSSSINHMDYSSMNMMDYRTNLGSVKATLDSHPQSSDAYNSCKYNRNCSDDKRSCSCEAPRGLHSRTPSMSSIRSNYSVRNSNGSAKTALLKEKLLGPRSNSGRTSNDATASPDLRKSGNSMSRSGYRGESAHGRSQYQNEVQYSRNTNNIIRELSPPPVPFGDARESYRHSSRDRRGNAAAANGYNRHGDNDSIRSKYDSNDVSGRPNSTASGNNTLRHTNRVSYNSVSVPHHQYHDSSPDNATSHHHHHNEFDEVDNTNIISPSKVSLLASKFNTAIKETESHYHRQDSSFSQSQRFNRNSAENERHDASVRPPSSRAMRGSSQPSRSKSYNNNKENFSYERHSVPLPPPPSASSTRHPLAMDENAVVNRTPEDIFYHEQTAGVTRSNNSKLERGSSAGKQASPPHSAGKIVSSSSGSDSGFIGSSDGIGTSNGTSAGSATLQPSNSSFDLHSNVGATVNHLPPMAPSSSSSDRGTKSGADHHIASLPQSPVHSNQQQQHATASSQSPIPASPRSPKAFSPHTAVTGSPVFDDSGNTGSIPPTPFGSPVKQLPSSQVQQQPTDSAAEVQNEVGSVGAPRDVSQTVQDTGSSAPHPTMDHRLNRGFSKAGENLSIVCKARNELTQGIWDALGRANAGTADEHFNMDISKHTFMLPDLSVYEDTFRVFVERDLIEVSTLQSLEQCGRLNWWTSVCQRLWPLATTGDGNCLLHAASLGMWGFHDRLLALRSALHLFLTNSDSATPLWRRWRWHTQVANAMTGLVYSDSEWATEWNNVIKLASTEPRNCGGGSSSSPTTSVSQHVRGATEDTIEDQSKNAGPSPGSPTDGSAGGAVYESLEEIHILALAHVLQRPIIVVADTTLKDVHGAPLSPIPFGGVYLPLECAPYKCQRSPLLLAYDAAHFSALVVMEASAHNGSSPLPAVIPLTTSEHTLLPVHFSVDPGEDFRWDDNLADGSMEALALTEDEKISLLHQYLDVVNVPILGASSDYPDLDVDYNIDQCGSPPDLKSSASSGGDSDDPDDPQSVRSSSSSQMVPPHHHQQQPMTMGGRKQRNTISKQFGSLSRSMSKRIKRNFSKIGKPNSGSMKRKGIDSAKGSASMHSRSDGCRSVIGHSHILGATIHTEKRMDFQEEMVEKYLVNVRKRFEEEKEKKRLKREGLSDDQRDRVDLTSTRADPNVTPDSPSECINPGCNMYGTAATSYMCTSCYDKQRQHEKEHELSRQQQQRVSASSSGSGTLRQHTDGAQYGAGKSQFYAEINSDDASKANSSIPTVKSIDAKKDSTLFLSNSTFYNDTGSRVQGGPSGKRSENSSRLSKRSGNSTNSNTLQDNNNGVDQKGSSAFTSSSNVENSVSSTQRKHCRKDGCEFFGSEYNDGYCSKCSSARY